MCGIFAYFKKSPIREDEINNCHYYSKLLAKRGPDNYGYVIKDNYFFSLNRLSINDLTMRGNQPFVYKNYILIFNGEIYNFKYLKKKLLEKNIKFVSNSDTEVLLHYLINFGVENIDELNGMFAFLFYDGQNIFCSTDIFGEKTLYFYEDKDKLIFSSELISLKKFSLKKISDENLYSYFSFGHLIEEQTFYKNIKKIIPGEILIIDKNLNIKKKKYFSMENYYLKNKKNLQITKKNLDELDGIFKKSFKNKCVGEKGKTLLFSGGLDSFVVSKYLKEIDDIKFIFFNDGKNNLNQNYEEYVKKKILKENIEIKNFLPKNIINLLHQPHYSFSAIAYQAMCKKIFNLGDRIALSGLGGDEVFMGYNKFFDRNKNFKSYLSYYYKDSISKIDKEISYLLNKSQSIFFLLKNKKYYEWLHDKFIEKYRGLSQVEKIYFSELEIFMPSSRCVVLDHSSMSQSIELRSCFLDIDILKWVLQFELHIINRLGPKKVLFNILDHKEKNFFVNYKKQPFNPMSEYNLFNSADINKNINGYELFFNLKENLKDREKKVDYYKLKILEEFI